MSLTNPLPQPPAAVGGPQRLTPLSREAVMSQLDRIAAADAPPLPGQGGLGGKAGVMALVGGLMVVGMALMWRAPDELARQPSAQAVPVVAAAVKATPAPQMPQVATASSALATAQTATAAAPVALIAAARPEPQALVAAAAEAAAPVSVANEDAARKARAKQQAAARRKAALLLAQEQAAREQQAQRDAALAESKRERAEQAAEEERRRVAAAERKRAAAAVVVAMDTSRRSVADTCAGSGSFFGQQSCRALECGRAEHQGDAVCVRLRDIAEVQRRASVDR